ncbi:MAG: S1 family peptidase [Proteobacteria bacterium]|nr:S1 family peptidase [Pseudomonadota bacterium]
MNNILKNKEITRKFSFLAMGMLLTLASQAGAVLIGPDDTEKDSFARAQDFPYTCSVRTSTHSASGVLVEKNEGVAWVLTVKHLVEGTDASDITVGFYGEPPLVCTDVFSPTFGHRTAAQNWDISSDIALLKIETTASLPEPVALFNPYLPALKYDKTWQIWRGEGHIIGYGKHGSNLKKLTLDGKPYHTVAPFFVDVTRDLCDEGCGFWNIISTFAQDRGLIAPDGTYQTLLTRDVLTPPRLGLAKPGAPTISDQIISHQGTTCPGDSGGPLVVFHEGTPYVLGIAFHAYSLAEGGLHTSLYSSVPYFAHWIRETIFETTLPRTTGSEWFPFRSMTLSSLPLYVDPVFLYKLKKKTAPRSIKKPPLGLHDLSTSICLKAPAMLAFTPAHCS